MANKMFEEEELDGVSSPHLEQWLQDNEDRIRNVVEKCAEPDMAIYPLYVLNIISLLSEVYSYARRNIGP